MKISRCFLFVFFLLSFSHIIFAQEKVTYLYQIVTPKGEQGKLHYVVESLNAGFRIVSFLSNERGGGRKDFELLVSKTWEPLLSRKWIQTPKGEMLLETRYGGKIIELQLQAPWGKKSTRLSRPSPVFDVEEVPFLLGFFLGEGIEKESIPVFIPISGMSWRGKLKKSGKDTEETTFYLTLAGEVITLRYFGADTIPCEVYFPHRGYVLFLKSVTPHE